jgi:hypothetical protein
MNYQHTEPSHYDNCENDVHIAAAEAQLGGGCFQSSSDALNRSTGGPVRFSARRPASWEKQKKRVR